MQLRTLSSKLLVILLCLFICPAPILAFSDSTVAEYQSAWKDRPLNERIVLWTERFVGTPYDKDPRGEYVTKRVIVADDRVDCMYLTFRSVELAMSSTPSGAVDAALDKRFHSRGILKDGLVANYEDRFEYGEDMIDSGKWGREITDQLEKTAVIPGSRGKTRVAILPARNLKKGMKKLKTGDLLFFIKHPAKRIRDEIVGHIGIVKIKGSAGTSHLKKVYLIHASGTKKKGGEVRKVLLNDYIKTMPYIGARITRF